jgi:Zn-dependent protease
MADDIEAQLKLYAETKRKEYVAKTEHGPTPHASHPAEVTERTGLLASLATPPEEHTSWCSCSGSAWQNNCFSCKCHPGSIEVLKLPISRSGIAVHIHYLWPLFVVISAVPAFWMSAVIGTFTLVVGGPILFFSVLIHELGHAVAALRLGGQVNDILLWPLGGVAYISFFGETSPTADAIVAISGPATHVPQFIFWYLCMYLSNHGVVSLTWPVSWGWNFWLCVCSAGMVTQISLLLFNLIPAFPLDGGRLLAASLAHCDFERRTALNITAFVGSIFGWYFLFGGISASTASEFAIFTGWNQVFIGMFILANCFELWQYSSQGAAHSHPGYPPARTASFVPVTSTLGTTSGVTTAAAVPRAGVHTVAELEQRTAPVQPQQSGSRFWPTNPGGPATTGGDTAGAGSQQPAQSVVAPKSSMAGPGRKLGSAPAGPPPNSLHHA